MENSITWREAERLFFREGPFSHINSSHIEDGFIFECDEERSLALLYMALAARETGTVILAYALMTNHFHFIVKGRRGGEFFQNFRQRMSLYLSRHGRPGLLDGMTFKETPITSLNQFYTEVAYVLRNPFVVSPSVNLLSYPWCSGYLYFNKLIEYLPLRKPSELSFRERRVIAKNSNGELPEWISVLDGMISPISFVDYRLVEALFRTPREFLNSCFKNVEAQVELALRIDEKPVLTDEELFRHLKKKIDTDYQLAEFKLLSRNQKGEILKYLKYKIGTSNGQIARVLHLSQIEVDSFFPLTAKNPGVL